VCGLIFVFAGVSLARAETVFYDDFEDGSATDGSPETWVTIANWPNTTFNVLGGNLTVGVSVPNPDRNGVVGVPAKTLGNTSIRAQVRFEGESNPDEGSGVFVRGDLVSYQAHSFEIASDGGLWFGTTGSPLQRIDSILRPRQEDVILQLDAIGDAINAWAWRAGDPMPATPAFSRITSQLPSGIAGVYKSASLSSQGTSTGTAIFRYVHVSNTSIPEPSSFFITAFALVALCVARRERRKQKFGFTNEAFRFRAISFEASFPPRD
jgi:hypothetical protein